MIKLLRRYRLLILTMLLTTGLLLGLGYFFAKQKSEPEFATKIDRIMFERKNKSPKFIITLPDAATRRAEVLGETMPNKKPTAPKKRKKDFRRLS